MNAFSACAHLLFLVIIFQVICYELYSFHCSLYLRWINLIS